LNNRKTIIAPTYKLEDMNARVYGVDAAVVTAILTGRKTLNGTFQGKDISARYRFTDVFVFRDGRWECVAAQSTLIAKK
jgi:hypothetical protein